MQRLQTQDDRLDEVLKTEAMQLLKNGTVRPSPTEPKKTMPPSTPRPAFTTNAAPKVATRAPITTIASTSVAASKDDDEE